MNSTILDVNSYTHSSLRMVSDYGYGYLLMALGIIALTTQLISVIVYAQKDILFKGGINIYSFNFSIDLVFIIISCLVVSRTRCGISCDGRETYRAKQAEFYGYFVLINTFTDNTIFIQLAMLLNQYFHLKRKKYIYIYGSSGCCSNLFYIKSSVRFFNLFYVQH